MKRAIMLAAVLTVCGVGSAIAQGFDSEPVFQVRLLPDRVPAVAGEELRLIVEITVDRGWHVNSDNPGDEFSLPTEVVFRLPEGWLAPVLSFPDGEAIEFEFSETPIEVWEHRAVILANLVVPQTAAGDHRLRVAVTAQACNNTQCLPPEEVRAGVDVQVASPGSSWSPTNERIFSEVVATSASPADSQSSLDLASKSLPLLLVGVFLAGLALNLTPCVFPLIPITVGFFTQQTKDREGSSFPLALAYVLGIALTYSVLGVLAAPSSEVRCRAHGSWGSSWRFCYRWPPRCSDSGNCGCPDGRSGRPAGAPVSSARSSWDSSWVS
jgi:thiol:disulfide interchange protein DsbD